MSAIVEHLQDGSLRLVGSRCTFIVTRLCPCVVLTSIQGKDTGDLGDLPLRAVTDEYARFRGRVHWFVDASRGVNAKSIVFQQWTEWFRTNQGKLAGVHVLTGNDPMQLTVSIARHISGIDDRMRLYETPGPFIDAISGIAQSSRSILPDSSFSEPPVAIHRTSLPGGGVQVEGPSCFYRIKLLAAGTVLTTISGNDSGELGAVPIDEVQAAVTRAGRGAAWYVDTRGVRGKLPRRVSDDWTAWLMAHENELQQVAVLSTSSAYPLILSIAKLRLRSPQIMQVYRDQEGFEAVLRRRELSFKGLEAAAAVD